jgi:hypothetical protein
MPKPVYRPKDVKNSLSILFSLPARLNNPDLIERAIPILCKAVKERSNNISDNDVVDYLEALAQEAAAHPTRDGLRSQIRLYWLAPWLRKISLFAKVLQRKSRKSVR